MAGRYIVIEGNDGTGKSTQVAHLAKWLKTHHNIDSYITEEPGGTPIADEIRLIIKNGTLERHPLTNVLLFTASRHEIWKKAEQALANGTWVIASRNWLSTLAYQGYGEGVDTQQITDITRQFTSERYFSPDHTIILSLDDAVRKERIAKRGAIEAPDTFEQKASDFQARVNQGYLTIARQFDYPVLSAEASVEDLAETIRQQLQSDQVLPS